MSFHDGPIEAYDHREPEPAISFRGETIDMENSTGQELYDAGIRLNYPYLVIRGQERQVVEGAVAMLRELDQQQGRN